MITAGIDLAAQPERTAVATIKWTAGCAIIENVACRADDEVILEVVKQADKTGIDCPFGWPAAFVSFVTFHQAGHVSIPSDWPSSGNLARRRTDVFVHERLRLTPLSVSADRIAHVAFRCALLPPCGTVLNPARGWWTPGRVLSAQRQVPWPTRGPRWCPARLPA